MVDVESCPTCDLAMVDMWDLGKRVKGLGCAIHGIPDVKGDKPGHPFHGNQYGPESHDAGADAEAHRTGMLNGKPAWHYRDSTGVMRLGTQHSSHFGGGTDFSRLMREAGTGAVHVISGSNLKHSEVIKPGSTHEKPGVTGDGRALKPGASPVGIGFRE